jgi:predicted dehydrogenase
VVSAAASDLNKAFAFLEEFGVKNGKAYNDFAELLLDPNVGGFNNTRV